MVKGSKKANGKESRLAVRLTDSEMDELERLASVRFMTKSELVRLLIQRACEKERESEKESAYLY